MPSVFLSHTSHDKPFVHDLAAKLRLFGVHPWVDEFEILPGDSLIAKIEEGIGAADYVAAILSTHSVNSEWVNRELRAALQGEISSRRVVVLPLVIDDCEIPVFLRDKLYVDFRRDFYTGLWAILRRLHGDDALRGASAEQLRDWTRLHVPITPLDRFKAYIRAAEEKLKERQRQEVVRNRIRDSGMSGIMEILSQSDPSDAIRDFASIFSCDAGCADCGQVLVDLTALSEQLSRHIGDAKSSSSLLHILETRYGTRDTISNGFYPNYCWDCAEAQQYRNQGVD